MSRDPNPHAPPNPGPFAARAAEAIERAEGAVAAADRDPQYRPQADLVLGEALDALRAFCAAAETAQTHARYLEMVGERDPERAERAREARKTFRRVTIQLEGLSARYRRADRRLLRFGRKPTLVERAIDWLAP